MAKVKAAFWGLGATGSIGKSIVFGVRKGQQVVRVHVVPSNPKTTAQTTERTQFTEGVDQWHDAKLIAVDKTAWNTRATIVGGGQSGFNQMISNVRKYPTANDHTLIYGLKMTAAGPLVGPKISADAAGTMSLKIIRGPGAGYSESKVMVADVEKSFTNITINSASLCVFEMTQANKTGESGYFKAVAF